MSGTYAAQAADSSASQAHSQDTADGTWMDRGQCLGSDADAGGEVAVATGALAGHPAAQMHPPSGLFSTQKIMALMLTGWLWTYGLWCRQCLG